MNKPGEKFLELVHAHQRRFPTTPWETAWNHIADTKPQLYQELLTTHRADRQRVSQFSNTREPLTASAQFTNAVIEAQEQHKIGYEAAWNKTSRDRADLVTAMLIEARARKQKHARELLGVQFCCEDNSALRGAFDLEGADAEQMQKAWDCNKKLLTPIRYADIFRGLLNLHQGRAFKETGEQCSFDEARLAIAKQFPKFYARASGQSEICNDTEGLKSFASALGVAGCSPEELNAVAGANGYNTFPRNTLAMTNALVKLHTRHGQPYRAVYNHLAQRFPVLFSGK